MKRRTMLALLAGLSLSACISVLPKPGPGPDIYTLQGTEMVTPVAHAIPVLLPVVQAPRMLKNNRVALVKPDGTYAYANSARWSGALPEMLQTRIADALDAQGSHVAVRPGEGVEAQLALHVRASHFEAAYDQGMENAPQARVELEVMLVNRHTRTLVARTHIYEKERANSPRLGDVTGALRDAAHRAAQDLAVWLSGVKSGESA